MASARTKAKLSKALKRYHRTGRKKATIGGHTLKGMGLGAKIGGGLGTALGALALAPLGPGAALGGAIGGGIGSAWSGAGSGAILGAGTYKVRKALRHRNYSANHPLVCFKISGVNLLGNL